VLASISGSITSQIADHGVYAVFLLMLIDAVFPAASELVMVYAGALAAGAFTAADGIDLFGATIPSGGAAYVTMALSGTLGYLIGSIIGWGIGRYGGRPLLERHGRWLHLTPAKLDRAERWFERWDLLAVLVGRVTPVVRSFISIPAGVFEMRLAPYTLLTAVGSAAWAFALAGVGWGLGSSYERFHHGFRYADYVVALAVVAGVALIVWKVVSRRRRGGRAAGPGYTGSSES
jgi:membrane protein DedA with SNARE-associated domain